NHGFPACSACLSLRLPGLGSPGFFPQNSPPSPPCRARRHLKFQGANDVKRRMLPEWTAQWGVMLTWPHAGTDWSGWMADIERTYGAIAREVTRRENLLVVVQDEAHAQHVRKTIAEAGGEDARVHVRYATANDTWARDHGPVTVATEDGLALLDFIFNGWGNKWPAKD